MHAEGRPAAAHPDAAAPGERRPAARAGRLGGELIDAVRPFAVLGALALAALVVVYAVALGTARGLSFDTTAIAGLDPVTRPDAYRATSDLVHTIDVESLALLGGGIVVVAIFRGRLARAVAAAAVLLGANVTTQVLKPLLGELDPLGGEPGRLIHAAFPSGHATVAMSIGLALVLVVPPALRVLAALLGAGYAAAIGVALLVLSWHYPSDVAGGYLVAAAWAAAAAGGLRLWAVRQARRPLRTTRWRRWNVDVRALVLGAAALVVAFVAVSVVGLVGRPGLVVTVALHTRFFLAAGAIVALSVALVAALTAALHRYPATPRPA